MIIAMFDEGEDLFFRNDGAFRAWVETEPEASLRVRAVYQARGAVALLRGLADLPGDWGRQVAIARGQPEARCPICRGAGVQKGVHPRFGVPITMPCTRGCDKGKIRLWSPGFTEVES